MNLLDWTVLFSVITLIVLYGIFKTKGVNNMEGYFKGGNSMKWWMIGVSIMATQASAITFLSTPGQAIEDGMRFIQFYLGLPLAMVIISITIVPIYYRLKVYTAYEYLESRFDLKTRTFTAILFLILRGLSAGITLFAPALILSTILEWNIFITTILIGVLVIIYTVSGGSKAVSITQQQQMAVIMVGMILAGLIAYKKLPTDVSFSDTIQLAGELGRLNIITTDFTWSDRFNIWSGLIASTFLFLSYFGTDQSQVGRYLAGKSLTESRMGLLMNGFMKIPFQSLILFIGVLVFVFYLFTQPPVFYNTTLHHQALQSAHSNTLIKLEQEYTSIYTAKKQAVNNLLKSIHRDDQSLKNQSKNAYYALKEKEDQVRNEVKSSIKQAIPNAKVQDRDYIFLNFVLRYMPHGIIGLLLAVMFSAAMSSMSSELNALAATTTVDIYKRSLNPQASARHYLLASRWFTVLWAVIAIFFATMASFAENLIQFVNIIGSLFYGTILGIFLVGFYLKKITSQPVFIAALVAQSVILILYFLFYEQIAFLFYNIIACIIVVVLAYILQRIQAYGVQKESINS